MNSEQPAQIEQPDVQAQPLVEGPVVDEHIEQPDVQAQPLVEGPVVEAQIEQPDVQAQPLVEGPVVEAQIEQPDVQAQPLVEGPVVDEQIEEPPVDNVRTFRYWKQNFFNRMFRNYRHNQHEHHSQINIGQQHPCRCTLCFNPLRSMAPDVVIVSSPERSPESTRRRHNRNPVPSLLSRRRNRRAERRTARLSSDSSD